MPPRSASCIRSESNSNHFWYSKRLQGEPVISANVMEKGTNRGIVTDLDGKFTLKVTPGATITVSYLGYKTQTLKAAPTMNVSLEEDNALLDEVVVVGFGTQKRANLTGAVATVDVSKAMDARPVGDVTKALQGAVPGLTITTGDGAASTQPHLSKSVVRVRCQTNSRQARLSLSTVCLPTTSLLSTLTISQKSQY